jgi:hypothetical protein
MKSTPANVALNAIMLCACLSGAARADVLLNETSAVGLPGAAPPSEFSFTASTAQALTLTLTDLKEPAAFSALQVAVTLGDVLVGTTSVSSTHAGTLAIPAAAGNYTLHVVGAPSAAQGIGSFGVCVAPATSASSCIAAYSFSDTITTPSTTSSTGTSTLTTNFTTSNVAGTYTVTLTDDAFPVALQTLSAGVLQGSTPIQVNIPVGTTTITTPLAANTSYNLLVAAIASASTEAGLYGIRITDPNGAAVFNRTVPVGTLPSAAIVDNTAAQALSLTLTDYAYPAALASVGVAVTQGSTALAALTAPGNVTNFSATAGSVEVWQYAVAGAQPGTYAVDLSVYQAAGGAKAASLLSKTQVVNPAGTTATSFAFVAALPSAGTYHVTANDFQFPAALQSISAPTVAQNGAPLTVSNGAFTAQAGAVVVLVNIAPPASGLGLFGVTVQTGGASPQVVLDQTQAVGGIFNTQVINLGTSGGYAATLADLKFPQAFGELAVVVSQNSAVVGKIYGAGPFEFNATPGQYVVSLVAIPASQSVSPPSLQDYGLYSLNISSAVPTLTFTASAASVTAGAAVTLTWTSQYATACTASGGTGWTGSEATSGTLAVSVAATETLSLTCTGPGGSAAQSVTVTATPASGGSGGGGTLAWGSILMLLALSIASRSRQAQPRSRP